MCRSRVSTPLPDCERCVNSPGFVAVQVVGAEEPAQCTAAHTRAIEVRLGDGRCVFVEPGFDAGHLRALLAVLEARV